MNALILAGGYGTRLGKLTLEIPKVMLPIQGEPLIDILIKKLLYLNFEKIIVNTHFKGHIIQNFLQKQDYFSNIIVAPEPKLLGTAGTLKENLNYLAQDDFLVMHGDNYFTDDLSGLKNFHKLDNSNSLMTMGTFITTQPELYGVVEIDSDKFINKFFEKSFSSDSNIANAAIYFFKKKAVKIISTLSDYESDISKDLLPKFVGRSKIYQLNGKFIDIGVPERYYSAQFL